MAMKNLRLHLLLMLALIASIAIDKNDAAPGRGRRLIRNDRSANIEKEDMSSEDSAMEDVGFHPDSVGLDHDFGYPGMDMMNYYKNKRYDLLNRKMDPIAEGFPSRSKRSTGRGKSRRRSKNVFDQHQKIKPGCCMCGDHLCCDVMCHGK